MELVLYIIAGIIVLWIIAFSLASSGHKKRMKLIVSVINEALKHKISVEHEMILLGYINKSHAEPDYAIGVYEKFQPILKRNGLERSGLGVADMTSQHLPEYVPPIQN